MSIEIKVTGLEEALATNGVDVAGALNKIGALSDALLPYQRVLDNLVRLRNNGPTPEERKAQAQRAKWRERDTFRLTDALVPSQFATVMGGLLGFQPPILATYTGQKSGLVVTAVI